MRQVVAALACASLVACSSAASSFTPAHSEPARVHAVTAHIVIKFPRHQHARGRAAQRRDPHYISQATDSVLFTLTQVNGAAPPSGFTTSVSVTLGSDCTGTGPYTCSTSWTVPAASDSFTVGAYDGPAGTGNLLSTNTVTKSITTGANTIGVTLDGVPASIAISGLPTNAVVGTAINATALTVNALDADGYTIVGAYSTPITLSDTDPTGTTTIATSGSDNPPAGELLSSADSATLSYTGGAFSSPATIAATSGNATGSAVFLAETVLHSFSGGTTDGERPVAGLVAVGNELYGTTYLGGASSDGTVFEIATSGSESVLHSFTGGTTDGSLPEAGLVDVGNELYGTTGGGGASGAGTVFEISTSGSESVLHSFSGGTTDGYFPVAALVSIGNELYGSTDSGGASTEGTVFAISTSGTESILHNFTGGTTDGSNPTAGLVAVGSELYGTTQDGAASGDGTVFEISTSGAESILHSFTGGTTDGSDPIGALVAVGSELYGTTYSGGASGKGTVFEISTSGGGYTVLHSFSGGTTDGANPQASLVAVGNELYGTTGQGGASNDGTVFEISTSGGGYTVLHSFSGADGAGPAAGLLSVGNNLYGTTSDGGASFNGTVFSIPVP